MKKILGQLAWFVMVGCAAAATHWLVAVLCISQWHWPASVGNFAGWLVALWVSFSGHYFLTFRHQHKTWWAALRRFALISFCEPAALEHPALHAGAGLGAGGRGGSDFCAQPLLGVSSQAISGLSAGQRSGVMRHRWWPSVLCT